MKGKKILIWLLAITMVFAMLPLSAFAANKSWNGLSFSTNMLVNGATRLTQAKVIFINGSSNYPGVVNGAIEADKAGTWSSHALLVDNTQHTIYATDGKIENVTGSFNYFAVVAWDNLGGIYIYADNSNDAVTYSPSVPDKFVVEGTSYNESAGGGKWFVAKKYVTTNAGSSGGGYVTSTSWSGTSGGWIDNAGSTKLTANASSGYYFTGWSDGTTTAERTITLTANAATTYTANFEKYQAKDGNDTYYATVAKAVDAVGTGTITATFTDTLTPANGVSLKKDVALTTKAGIFTAVDGAATISVAEDGGVTLTNGKLKVARANDEAVVKVVTSGKTVEVKIPANTEYTVDANEVPATVGKLGKGKSVEIGGITYTAGADATDFTIGNDTLTGADDTATVPKGTQANITLGGSGAIIGLNDEDWGNTASTIITKGSTVEGQETDTTVKLQANADSFQLSGKRYSAANNGATFVVDETADPAYAYLKEGNAYIGSYVAKNVDVLIGSEIFNVAIGDNGGIVVNANTPDSGAATATVNSGTTMTVKCGEVTKSYPAVDSNATFIISGGEDCYVALTSGTTTLEKDQEIFAGTTDKRIFNTGDKTITVSVNGGDTSKATLTVPAGGKVKVATSDTYYNEYEAVEEATIVVENGKNTITNGSVKLVSGKVISVGNVAVENRYSGTGRDLIVSGNPKTVTAPEGGMADIGWANITDIMQKTIITFDKNEDAVVALAEEESVTINGVTYTGGEGGGAITINPKTGKVTKIDGNINIEIDEKNLIVDFSYDLVPGQSVTVGKYVYTAPENGTELGDVTIKGRGVGKNPAVVLKNADGTVDVALATNKNTKTTYTAANANTTLVMSADDTNTARVDLLNNGGSTANSALKFADNKSHTVNGVTYQGQADNSGYTVTFGEAEVDSGRKHAGTGAPVMETVNRNTVSVASGSKVTATMDAKGTINIANSRVGDKGSSDKPFTASNSGASVLIDNTDGTSMVSGCGSTALTPEYDQDGNIIGYEVRRRSSGGSGMTVTVSGDKSKIEVNGKISGTTVTISEITAEEIDAVGADENVVIALGEAGQSISSATLTVGTLKNVISSEAEALEIQLPTATVVLDKPTLKALTEQASADDLRLVVDDDTAARKTLNTAQKSSLSEMNEPTVIETYFVSGDERISDFKGGTVSISIELDTDKPIRVWYLKENGECEKVDAAYDKKTATLKLKHFSHYVIEQLDDSMGYASCPKDATCPIEPFPDAVNAAWYHDGVHYCVENSLMKGYDDGKFGTNDNISRGQIVTILWRLEGSPAVSGGNFDDIASNAYYAKAVAWAAEHGIVGGYGDGRFGPNDPITREQLAAILYRYAQFKSVDVSVGEDTNIMDFDDAQSISSYAVPAIQWACGSGIMAGTSDTTLSPAGTATRAQAACLMQRFLTNGK